MSGPNNSSSTLRSDAGMTVLEVVIMAVGMLLLAIGFKQLSGHTENVSSLWLANGFAVGMLLTSPQTRWPLMLATAGVAGAGGAYYLKADPTIIPWITVLNLAEILFAAWMLRTTLHVATDLTRKASFLLFLLHAVVLAPALFLGLLWLFIKYSGRHFDFIIAQRVLIGHALGMAVMAPVTLALRNGELRNYLKPDVILESLLTLGMLTTITALVFYQDVLPLMFLIFPPMLLTAYRGGFVGTAVALLIVVTIGAVATATGHGPIYAAQANAEAAQYPLLADGFLLLQVFIAALLVSLFPMIVSIAEGRRANRATSELQNRLRVLMEHSSDVIILTDLDGRRLYVSPTVREVIGIDPDVFLHMTWQDYVHELDREMVGSEIESAQRSHTSRTLVFRAHHASGKLLWIEAHMKYFRDQTFDLMQAEKESGLTRNCGEHGDEGFVVTMRDISARRRAELELESANTELASLIRKDSLTGLANRRRFDEVLEDAWAKALAGGWPIAVLMIDVDHFKQFNDAYGHQRGDLALRDVAMAITSGLFHPEDVAARYGGEEFSVVLPKTSTDNAARVAERIRRAVHELRRPHMASPLGVLTVSVGVAAAYPIAHGGPLAVVRAADQALYTSKNEGRNRLTLLDVTWPNPASSTGGFATLPAADSSSH